MEILSREERRREKMQKIFFGNVKLFRQFLLWCKKHGWRIEGEIAADDAGQIILVLTGDNSSDLIPLRISLFNRDYGTRVSVRTW